ncbi:hypothetical protein F4806DRAFT_491181 [Annulohypoxylon nitens]|nr:hypothetical protein F4806DRAFT_491181 [Annulohypoxylon nitens]
MSDYLEYFDFDAFPDSDEYTLDFQDLDTSYPIGQEEQNFASNATLPPLPNATEAPVESPLDAETQSEFSLSQHDIHAAIPKTYGSPNDLAIGLQQSASSENQDQDLNTPVHQQIQGRAPFSCAQCHESFLNKAQPDFHGLNDIHKAFACSCGRSFTRSDALDRHLRSNLKDERPFPCTFRKCPRSKRGFSRRDHLAQHLQNYHKLNQKQFNEVFPAERHPYDRYHCIFPMCELNGGEESKHLDWIEQRNQAPFKKRSDYMKHLKEIHNATPFPCPVTECKRIGPKGYTSFDGLKKHLDREHKLTPEDMKLKERDRARTCGRCRKSLTQLEDLNLHHQLVCREE